MLKIENIAEFRKNVLHKEEIRESDIGENSTCFCYMVSAEGTFDSAWTRECRGITFDSTSGKVNGRSLHKFFNVNERESTQVHNVDWTKVVRVMNKQDGSMLTSVITPSGVKLKSKKTFTSDVAVAANKWMNEHQNVIDLVQSLADQNLTAIFEWTAPDARIVLFYPEPKLTLLHVRDNETGVYMGALPLLGVAASYGVDSVEEIDEFFIDGKFNIKSMLEAAETREGVEGWVVQLASGEMLKLKTKWYVERHRLFTFIRERDIAEAVLNESIDDMKATWVSEDVDIQEILDIEARVLSIIRSMIDEVEMTVSFDRELSQKDFAIKHSGNKYFGLMMKQYGGKEPDYKGYFTKHLLKEAFGLRQLVLMPSIAEGD